MAGFSTEEWRRVSSLVDELLELDPREREERLDHELAGEPGLRARVEKLLHADRAADRAAGQFLAPPSGEVVAGVLAEFEGTDGPDSGFRPGAQVGAYRLLREIDHGGMGTVYLAERDDSHYRQRVALKLVRGGVAGHEARARFYRERQILADLDHPNIARLLDGGSTPDGVPYLVMEYVEGYPIDRYCDDRALGVRGRLGLFAEVCEAVQYAHGQLVVHRDLKPANILVTDHGRVKLLDFGVAKLLDPDLQADAGLPTRTGVRLLTPEFASPEQLAGRPVTVASDVYSLGVLLYLLLSGHLPHEPGSRNIAAFERDITAHSPERPSSVVTREARRPVVVSGASPSDRTAEMVALRRATTPGALRRRLRGDLDNIVLKALRGEPARRYGSVSALHEDVRRHVTGLPVTARPATMRYRLRLYARRNRVALVATGLVIVALLAGLAGTAWQARAASLEARKATQVTEFVLGLFEVADPASSRGDSITARQLLERGAERVERELHDQPLVRAEMTHVLGTIYWKLGEFEPAERMLRRAHELRAAERGRESIEAAESLVSLGAVAMLQARYTEADSLLDAGFAILRRRLRANDPRLADALAHRAVSARHQNDLERSEALHREALRIRREALGAEHPATMGSLKDLALVLHSLNRLADADAVYRQALSLMLQAHGENHPDVGTTLHSLAVLSSTLGRLDEAEALAERALRVQRTVHGPRHRLVANAMDELAFVLDQRGELERSIEVLREVLEMKRELLGERHPGVATSLNNLALPLRDTGRLDEAEAYLLEALAIYRDRFGGEHPSVSTVLDNLGSVELRRGRWSEAETLYGEALAIQRATLPEPHLYTATSLVGLGGASLEGGRSVAAEAHLVEAVGMLEALLEPPHWRLAEAYVLLARAVAEQGRYPQAAALAAAALESTGDSGRHDAEQAARAREALASIRLGAGSAR